MTIAPLLLCWICSSCQEDNRVELTTALERISSGYWKCPCWVTTNNRWLVEHADFLPFRKLFSLLSIQSAHLLDLDRWNIDTLFNLLSYTSNGNTYDFLSSDQSLQSAKWAGPDSIQKDAIPSSVGFQSVHVLTGENLTTASSSAMIYIFLNGTKSLYRV